MALDSVNAFPDRVWESSASTGTGNITLAGAVLSIYQTLNNAVGTGVRISYFLAHKTDGTWERGEGELSDATTFVRSSVSNNSSGAASAIDFASGGLFLYATVHGGSLSWATKRETLENKTLTDPVISGGEATLDYLLLDALGVNYNLADVQCLDVYMGEDSNGWERRTNLSYNDETVPTGSYLGQYATVTDAANDGGAVEDWFYNTTDSYFYKITATGTPAASRIYRAGSAHLPLARAAVVVGTGSGTRLIIFDLTQDGCPMWAEIIPGITTTTTDAIVSKSVLAFSTDSAGAYLIDFGRATISRYATSGFALLPFSNWHSWSGATWIIKDSTNTIPSNVVNALATYTAPNAPLDAVTGMPIPYIAGGTAGGMFVIKPGGTVLSDLATNDYSNVFEINGRLFGNYTGVTPDYFVDKGTFKELVDNFPTDYSLTNITTPALSSATITGMWPASDRVLVEHADGLDLLIPNPNTPAESLIAKIGTNFSTGWMCKPLAAVMCDTTEGNISDTDLYPDSDAAHDDTNSVGDWTAASGAPAISVDSSVVDGGNTYSLKIVMAENAARAAVNISDNLEAGKIYQVSLRARGSSSASNANVQLLSGVTSNSTDWLDDDIPNDDTWATYSFYIDDFAGGAAYIAVKESGANDDGTVNISGITIQEVAADRSDQENHFDVVGTLSRTAIETGGIAAYSGFSAANYLSSADADFDSNGASFTWPIAFKSSSASEGPLIDLGENVGGKWRLLRLTSTTGYLNFSNGSSSTSTPGSYTDGNWHVAVLVANSSGDVEVWCDGEKVIDDSFTFTAYTFSDIRLGSRRDGGTYFDGELTVFSPSSAEWTPQQIRKWSRDTMRMLESGAVTLANTITDAHYDERNGVTRLLDSDSQERQLNGLVIESTRDFDAGDSIDVGTVAAGASDGRGRATGGSTGVYIEVEAKNVREEQPRRAYEYFDIKYEGDGAETSFPSAAADVAAVEGCYPISVTDAGSKQTEGSSDDYTVDFDGFNYWVEFAVAPSNTNDVIVTWRRGAWK